MIYFPDYFQNIVMKSTSIDTVDDLSCEICYMILAQYHLKLSIDESPINDNYINKIVIGGEKVDNSVTPGFASVHKIYLIV